MFTLTNVDTNLENQYTIKELTYFKHGSIISVDVERSFSMYKTFFRPNRLNFTFKNIKKTYLFMLIKVLFKFIQYISIYFVF